MTSRFLAADMTGVMLFVESIVVKLPTPYRLFSDFIKMQVSVSCEDRLPKRCLAISHCPKMTAKEAGK